MPCIYALIDPRNNRVRYIGKSDDLEDRVYEHFKPSKLKLNDRKAAWLRLLLSMDMKPEVKVLEELTHKQWKSSERYWINFYKDCDLLNMKAGTGGHTEETRKKISLANKGKGHDIEWRINHSKVMKGRKASDITKQKMSKKHTGNERACTRKFVVVFPNNNNIVINNLSSFCREHNLSVSCMQKIADSKEGRKQHKGFWCYYADRSGAGVPVLQ